MTLLFRRFGWFVGLLARQSPTGSLSQNPLSSRWQRDGLDGFSYRGTTALAFLRQTMDSSTYCAIISTTRLTFVEVAHSKGAIFQQDYPSCHTFACTSEHFMGMGITDLEWPAQFLSSSKHCYLEIYLLRSKHCPQNYSKPSVDIRISASVQTYEIGGIQCLGCVLVRSGVTYRNIAEATWTSAQARCCAGFCVETGGAHPLCLVV